MLFARWTALAVQGRLPAAEIKQSASTLQQCLQPYRFDRSTSDTVDPKDTLLRLRVCAFGRFDLSFYAVPQIALRGRCNEHSFELAGGFAKVQSFI